MTWSTVSNAFFRSKNKELKHGQRNERTTYDRKEELEVKKREIAVQAEKQDQAKKQQQATFSALMAEIQQQQQRQKNV